MKITSVEAAVVHYVETDEQPFGTFRRGSPENWEQLMGESWEPAYSLEAELEAAFQQWLARNVVHDP